MGIREFKNSISRCGWRKMASSGRPRRKSGRPSKPLLRISVGERRGREKRAPSELAGEIATFLTGREVGRNASCFSANGVLEGLSLRAHPLGCRFSSIARAWGGCLRNWLRGALLTKRPIAAMGASHSDHEVRSHRPISGRIQPAVAVLMTPPEVVAATTSPMWTQHIWIDSLAIGEDLGGRWDVLLRARRGLNISGSSKGGFGGASIAPRYEWVTRGE